MTEPAIPFLLDKAATQSELVYRPYGTRTVKLVVSSPGREQPPLRLRPARVKAADVLAGTFRGFAADSDALMLSWGGGHEPGPCVKARDRLKVLEEAAPLPAGEKSHLYFNLTHMATEAPPEGASLTLEAYEPGGDDKPDQVVSTLEIALKRPEAMPAAARTIQAAGDGRWQVTPGTHLPRYDPRWWSEAARYDGEAAELPLQIRRDGNRLGLYWGDSPDPLANITDRTEPSLLTAGNHLSDYANTVLFELFNFDDHHVALRVWFFWLNKQIGGKLFVGRHEVPDAERFDFILRKATGEPIFVCTDLHWSEVWGEVATIPLEVSLGLSRDKIMAEALAMAAAAPGKLWSTAARWIGAKKAGGVDESVEPYNPMAFIRGRVKARYEKESLNQVRDKGTEAHVPQLLNVIEVHPNPFTGRNQMVSNDVRLVFE